MEQPILNTTQEWFRSNKENHNIRKWWKLDYTLNKGRGYRSVRSKVVRIKRWVCHFNSTFMVV